MSSNIEIQRQQVERLTFIRAVVGSKAYGLNLPGAEDRDEMGVCIEPITDAVGLRAPFEQFVYRTASVRDGRHDAPSRPGDLDLTIYGLRKFLRLACDGNPSVLMLLFVPVKDLIVGDARAGQMRELTPLIISRQAGKRFLGYMQAQKQRLLGERGQMRVHRPELVEAYGYDTKYAMHMLRLGLEGVELMRTGRITLPMAEPERSWLMGLRQGHVELQDALTRAGELEAELKDLAESSPLQAEADVDAVQRWACKTYLNWWHAEHYLELARDTQHIVDTQRKAA